MTQTYIQKKYNLHSNKALMLYALNTNLKKTKALKELRNIKSRNLNILNLPSAFSFNNSKNMQNPKVILIYSKVLNFDKLAFLSELQSTCFKLKSFWYAHFLLKECLDYKNPSTLISSLCFNLCNYNIQAAYFFKNGSTGNTNN